MPDPTKVKTRKQPGVKPTRQKSDVEAAAEVAIREGRSWRDFCRGCHPKRQLDAAEMVALKKRFEEEGRQMSPN